MRLNLKMCDLMIRNGLRQLRAADRSRIPILTV